MFIQIAPGVRVFVTNEQLEFIRKHMHHSFRNSDLQPQEIHMAKVLGDKSIFVRKKLDNDVQFALNKRIKFIRNATKK
mgnify:CR=1 FL=1